MEVAFTPSVAKLPACRHQNRGKMIISLSLNITMNQLGGASVIAKFHSWDVIIQGYTLIQSIPSTRENRYV